VPEEIEIDHTLEFHEVGEAFVGERPVDQEAPKSCRHTINKPLQLR